MPKNDDIDEQAKKLLDMLLSDQPEGSTPRPKVFSKEKARWSTTGSAYSMPQENEPKHPVLVACDQWRKAITLHDQAAAVNAAHNLFLALQGYEGRPPIAKALEFLKKHQPDDAENVPVIDSVAAFVKQSQ